MLRLVTLSTAAIALAGHVAVAATVVVDPSNPHGWSFSDADNTPSATDSGQFVTGPSTPPLGVGSANLVVGAANSSEILINTSISPFSITGSFSASYQTFVTNSSSTHSGAAPTLQFDLFNGTTFFGRLVFDPGQLGTVQFGQWQSWDTSTGAAWFFSHSASQFSGDCGLNTPCDLATIKNDLNTLGLHLTANDVLFKAGSGLTSFNGNVDDLNLKVSSDIGTTFDFEPNPVPEPASLALLGTGILGLAGLRARRRNAAES